MNISRSIAAIIVAIILALGLIFSVLIFTHYHKWNRYGGGGGDDNGYYKQAKISVTGIAEIVFPADVIKVTGKLNNNTNKEAFINALLDKDISKDDIQFTNNTFTIQSEFVRNVEDVINNKTQNQRLGLVFDKPKYYLKNTEEVRLKMLAAATKNARAKAGTIVENGNGVLGSVVQSDMGKISYFDINSSTEFTTANDLNSSVKKKKVRLIVHQVYDVK